MTQKLILRHGDCVEVLKGYEDGSIGAVVSDPPYGLEFMGKKWDRLDWTDGGGMMGVGMGGREIPWPSYSGTGAAGTANATCATCGGRMRGGNKCSCDKPDWRVKGQPLNLSANAERMQKQQHSHRIWLTEAFRVLRPGGVIKAFSGTRTFHRMAYAMREAGFVDLRIESWNYGCLSEDTEVLTRNGWEHYHKATVGTDVMGFDPMTEDFRWMPVEDTYEYAYNREAYRLVGEGSDHIVSTNHRCLVERDGEWSFVYAEQLEDTEAVPCVSVRLHPQEQDASVVQPEVCCGEDAGGQETFVGAQWSVSDLHRVREGVLEARSVDPQGYERPGVLTRVQRGEPGEGLGEARPQGYGCGVPGVPQACCGEDAGSEQPRMEGGCDLLPQEGRVPQAEDQVCAVPAPAGFDGSQGRVRHGASASGSGSNRSAPDLYGGRASCEPQRGGQQHRELDAVPHESGSQVVRGARYSVAHLERSTVRVERIDYKGMVWCVKVPTGAFVARRNGMAFVTGNSGFPKSMNIGKKLAQYEAAQASDPFWLESNTDVVKGSERWNGWGTALKPSWEPVVVGRKPE